MRGIEVKVLSPFGYGFVEKKELECVGGHATVRFPWAVGHVLRTSLTHVISIRVRMLTTPMTEPALELGQFDVSTPIKRILEELEQQTSLTASACRLAWKGVELSDPSFELSQYNIQNNAEILCVSNETPSSMCQGLYFSLRECLGDDCVMKKFGLKSHKNKQWAEEVKHFESISHLVSLLFALESNIPSNIIRKDWLTIRPFWSKRMSGVTCFSELAAMLLLFSSHISTEKSETWSESFPGFLRSCSRLSQTDVPGRSTLMQCVVALWLSSFKWSLFSADTPTDRIRSWFELILAPIPEYNSAEQIIDTVADVVQYMEPDKAFKVQQRRDVEKVSTTVSGSTTLRELCKALENMYPCFLKLSFHKASLGIGRIPIWLCVLRTWQETQSIVEEEVPFSSPLRSPRKKKIKILKDVERGDMSASYRLLSEMSQLGSTGRTPQLQESLDTLQNSMMDFASLMRGSEEQDALLEAGMAGEVMESDGIFVPGDLEF